jgi:hypothetical protein
LAVVVEFFEHVGFQLGVGVDLVEQLGLLLAGGLFEQVGDPRGLEPA